MKKINLPVEEILMLADIKITQMGYTLPLGSSTKDIQVRAEFAEQISKLNILLKGFLTFEGIEENLFKNEVASLLVEKPEYLDSNGRDFLGKRLNIYKKNKPNLFKILESIESQDAAAA